MSSHYADTFLQTAYRKPLSSVDARGIEVYGAAVSFSCRVEKQPRLVRDSAGIQVVATGRIFTETQVQLTDLLFPPGSDPNDNATSVRPISVADAVDLMTGQVDHFEVYY